ncbi:MAG: hypothetical protein ACRD9R_21060 [Pyrinomonadaceae bacterium]
MSQPGRSRIVVNIGDLPPRAGRGGGGSYPPPAAGGRRAARKPVGLRRVLSFIALVSAILLIASAAGLYFWWQGTKSGPAYALALAADAAGRGERQEFDALVDIDAVTRGMVPQVVEKATGRGSTLALPAPARRFLAENATVLLPGSRDMIRDALMEEIKTASEKSGAAGYPFFVRALALPYLAESVTTNAEGANANAATVVFKVNERPVELQLRRADERGNTGWKIVNVKSDELAARVAQRFAQSVSTFGR